MSKKAWIIFAVVAVAFLSGLVFLNRKERIDVSGVDENKVLSASVTSGNIADHVLGKKDSKAILIEYGDFACPACKSAYPVLKELVEEYGEKMAFVFRNNPLTTMHPNARAGAAAAEAAGLQGKFWEMHDILYEQQNNWANVSSDKRLGMFENYAKEVGVKDMNKFRQDMASKAINKKIDFDLALGSKIPVQGTPTITLNGKKLEADVWSDKEKFKSALEEALK